MNFYLFNPDAKHQGILLIKRCLQKSVHKSIGKNRLLQVLFGVHPKIRIFVQNQGMHKNNPRHMFDIPRLIFVQNDEIGRKDHFRMNTIYLL